MKTAIWVVLGVLLLVGVVLLLPFGPPAHAQVPSITIVWTSPGDDGNVGTASSYQIKYRTVSIAGTDTLGWWNAATLVTPSPVPKVAGTVDSTVVVGPFAAGSNVYFIMRALDDGLPGAGIPNISGFSNVAIKVVPDITAPSRIIDLITR